MTPSARISAAIEVLTEIEARRRPATDALKDWGLSHRFAGSGDRAAIATLAYDALRRRASSRFVVGEDSARATIVGMLSLQRGMTVDAISALFSGERFAPAPLSDAERFSLETKRLDDAPSFVQADVPEWIWPQIEAMFGPDAIGECQALASRAPLDLRVNTLKKTRDELLEELQSLGAAPTPYSPLSLRIPLDGNGRSVSVQSEEAFQKGWFEIQDEGSQIATLLTGAKPGDQVLDLCAGGGGKTLALAALMDNKGQIFATDSDKRRLAPIHDRLSRAGVRNVQVRTPRGILPIDDLDSAMDLTVVDAPCTGSGTWRRNPDAKWRLRPGSVAERQKDQANVLGSAARTVKPGGRLVYITCSILPAENDDQVTSFLSGHSAFDAVAPAEVATQAGLESVAHHLSPKKLGLMLTPSRTGTDGFYIAVMRRQS